MNALGGAVLATLGVTVALPWWGCSSDAPPPAGKVCHQIGCWDSVTFVFPVVTTLGVLSRSTIEVCRNGECSTEDFPTAARAWVLEPIQAAVLPTDGGVLHVKVSHAEHGGMFQDGDAYRVRIVDGSSNVLVNFERTVSYEVDYPNGKDCDLVPCRHTTVDAT